MTSQVEGIIRDLESLKAAFYSPNDVMASMKKLDRAIAFLRDTEALLRVQRVMRKNRVQMIVVPKNEIAE